MDLFIFAFSVLTTKLENDMFHTVICQLEEMSWPEVHTCDNGMGRVNTTATQ